MEITASIDGTFEPTSSTLFYRRGGEQSFQSTALTLDGSSYQTTIPAAFVTLRGVDYYVSLSDDQTTVTFPATDPASSPEHVRVRLEETTTAAVTLPPLTYQMVSVPLVFDDPGLSSVLADDYGAYDSTAWRLFRWNEADDDYRELPDLIETFTPGMAFWLNTRTGTPFDVEGGLSVDASTPQTVTLTPGWNQIATPFAFPVAWASVSNSDRVEAPVAYDGAEYQYEQTVLEPWRGYFVFNPLPGQVTLNFSPVEATAAASKTETEEPLAERGSYVLQLVATLPAYGLRQTQTYFGLSERASAGHDALDVMEAPPVGSHLRVSLIEDEGHLAASFKPVGADSEGQQGQQWLVEVEAVIAGERLPQRKQVTLRLQEHGVKPENFDVHVFDEASGRELATQDGLITLWLDPTQPPHQLRVAVGTAAFAQTQREAMGPLETALEPNYPNPFNPQTTIGYVLGEPVEVALSVYDVLGRRVRVLVRGEQAAGRYAVAWDGRSDAGEAVASGVYFCRLEAGGMTATRQMLLVR